MCLHKRLRIGKSIDDFLRGANFTYRYWTIVIELLGTNAEIFDYVELYE